MSQSDAFKELRESIRALENEYIQVAATGSPSLSDQERARAFLIFAHAEIEHYIERACRQAADDLFAALKLGRVTSATLSFLAFNSIQPLNGGDTLGSKKKAARQLTTVVGHSIDAYLKIVDSNEGIREKHLAKLLVPLGICSNDVASAWLLDMDALASKRGQIAHMSRTDSAADPRGFNPADISSHVHRVVFARAGSNKGGTIESLEHLDRWILRVSTNARRVARSAWTPLSEWSERLGLRRLRRPGRRT